jgi:dTDP-4-dehydrorhamnose reductase
MINKRVLVTGSSGQLAKAIQATWKDADLFLPAEADLDLARREAIQKVLKEIRPDVVINAAAFTQVDLCESQVDRAFLINGEAVAWLAEACNECQALLVQISTDYVFDGLARIPYREEDETNPKSVYGRSKLRGEQEVQRCLEHLILRTSWLYDGWGNNFRNTMLAAASKGRSLRVVNDQTGSPTTCRALARQIRAAVNEEWRGLVHATCNGETTWYGFALEIFRQAGIQADISPCPSSQYPLPAPRPSYSVLDGSRRAVLGTDLMPSWLDALAEVTKYPEL